MFSGSSFSTWKYFWTLE